MKYTVYSVFCDEILLYVGCTADLEARTIAHRCSSRFKGFPKKKLRFVANAEFTLHADAVAEEIRLIALHNPQLNKHRGGGGVRRKVGPRTKIVIFRVTLDRKEKFNAAVPPDQRREWLQEIIDQLPTEKT